MPKKYASCVKKVKAQNKVKPRRKRVNAHAKCHAKMSKKKK